MKYKQSTLKEKLLLLIFRSQSLFLFWWTFDLLYFGKQKYSGSTDNLGHGSVINNFTESNFVLEGNGINK